MAMLSSSKLKINSNPSSGAVSRRKIEDESRRLLKYIGIVLNKSPAMIERLTLALEENDLETLESLDQITDEDFEDYGFSSDIIEYLRNKIEEIDDLDDIKATKEFSRKLFTDWYGELRD